MEVSVSFGKPYQRWSCDFLRMELQVTLCKTFFRTTMSVTLSEVLSLNARQEIIEFLIDKNVF